MLSPHQALGTREEQGGKDTALQGYPAPLGLVTHGTSPSLPPCKTMQPQSLSNSSHSFTLKLHQASRVRCNSCFVVPCRDAHVINRGTLLSLPRHKCTPVHALASQAMDNL